MSIYTRKEMAMLYDASKCTGCKGCQVACKQWNVLYSNLGMNAFPFSGSYQNPEDLNGSNRLVMTFKEKKSDNQLRPVEWAFGRRSCFHCTNAGCVTVCPTGCLKYEENGVVSVSPEKCIGWPAATAKWPVRLTFPVTTATNPRSTSARCAGIVWKTACFLPASRHASRVRCTSARETR